MKKILLGTVALVAMTAGAQAADLDLKIGGAVEAEVGMVDDERVSDDSKFDMRTRTDLFFAADGEAASGLGYGAKVTLKNYADNDLRGGMILGGSTLAIDNSFVYLNGTFGQVEAGDVDGAGTAFSIKAPGADTHFWDYAGTPHVTEGFNSGSATKVSYYTPEMNGFRAGVSYTPTLGEQGNALTFDRGLGYENGIELGAAWSGDMQGVGLTIGGTYAMAQAGDDLSNAGLDDLGGFSVGAQASWQNLTVGGAYIADQEADDLEVTGYNLGASYAVNKLTLSGTWLRTTVENSTDEMTNDAFVVGAGYDLAPGIEVGGEISAFDEEFGMGGEGDGYAAIVSTKVNF